MKHLLLLHGAAGAKDQFEPIIPSLSGVYQVHAINFSGHGGKNSTAVTFSIALFAQDVLHYMAVKQLDIVDIFGYSLGGYVALYIARHYPEKIGKIIESKEKNLLPLISASCFVPKFNLFQIVIITTQRSTICPLL